MQRRPIAQGLGDRSKYKLPEKMVQAAENKDLLMTQVVLTIGGSDSPWGRVIEAEFKNFRVLGMYGTCAVRAITAQNHWVCKRLVWSGTRCGYGAAQVDY